MCHPAVVRTLEVAQEMPVFLYIDVVLALVAWARSDQSPELSAWKLGNNDGQTDEENVPPNTFGTPYMIFIALEANSPQHKHKMKPTTLSIAKLKPDRS